MNTQTITTTGWTGRLDMGLAPRELEATMLAAADLTVKQVAQVMGIAPKTVEKRLEAARLKLGAKSIRGLVIEALKRGVIAFACGMTPGQEPKGHEQHGCTMGVLVA